MICHENADAMILASALMRGIPPWTSAILNIIRGGECLSNAHWLGPWRQHFDDELPEQITVTPKSLENHRASV